MRPLLPMLLTGLVAACTVPDVRDTYYADPFAPGPADLVRLARPEREVATILFAPGSAALTPSGRRAVLDAAAEIGRDLSQPVQVVAVADETGSENGDYQLARRRSLAVADVLEEAGVPPARIDLEPRGNSRYTPAKRAVIVDY
ncbi:MAG: OmpA family protein [Solirubrobacterales bacterium]